MLKIGLIGCGTHAHWAIIPAIRAMSGGCLAAIAEPCQEQTHDLDLDGIKVYTDYREMLQREALDLVYVATPCEAHAECTIAALEHGCHVACEKPMAMTVADCRHMNDAAEKHGKLLAIDFETRYLPPHRQIRQWITEGRIGRLQAMHIDSMWDGHKINSRLGERRHRFLEQTGCLDCGIHKLDIARFYAGGGDWQALRALGAWFGETSRFAPHIAIQGYLTPDIIVTLNDSFACLAAIPARYHHQQMIILGDSGIIALEPDPDDADAHRFHLVSESLDAIIPLSETGHTQPITAFLNDIARTLNGEQALPPELPTGKDGLAAQIAVETANQSALDHRPVTDGGDTA